MKLIKIIEYPIFPILVTSLLFGIIAIILTPVIPKESSLILIENIIKSMIKFMMLGAFLAWIFIIVRQKIYSNSKL